MLANGPGGPAHQIRDLFLRFSNVLLLQKFLRTGRIHRSNLQAQLLSQVLENFGAGDEIGFAAEVQKHSYLPAVGVLSSLPAAGRALLGCPPQVRS